MTIERIHVKRMNVPCRLYLKDGWRKVELPSIDREDFIYNVSKWTNLDEETVAKVIGAAKDYLMDSGVIVP